MENKEIMENTTKQFNKRMKKVEKISSDLKAACNLSIENIKQRYLPFKNDELELINIICMNNIALEYLCKNKYKICTHKCEKAKENIFTCEYCEFCELDIK
jgi:hypothetical protein